MTAELDAMLRDIPVDPPTLTGALGRPPLRIPNPEIARRNRRNRNRGNSTSRELAKYLGCMNVEALKLPHDVQANTLRLQSKRLASLPGPAEQLRLIDYITPGDWLRGLFTVQTSRRLTSGSVTFRLEEFTGWYGWALPRCDLFTAGSVALIRVALPAFADVFGVAA